MHGSGENAPEHREEKGPNQDPDGKQNFVLYFVIVSNRKSNYLTYYRTTEPFTHAPTLPYKPGGQKIENYKFGDFERIKSL